MGRSIKKEILEQIAKLPLAKQRLVLRFARGLTANRRKGVPGRALLQFSGTIQTEDLRAMSQAIEEACEKVDVNAW